MMGNLRRVNEPANTGQDRSLASTPVKRLSKTRQRACLGTSTSGEIESGVDFGLVDLGKGDVVPVRQRPAAWNHVAPFVVANGFEFPDRGDALEVSDMLALRSHDAPDLLVHAFQQQSVHALLAAWISANSRHQNATEGLAARRRRGVLHVHPFDRASQATCQHRGDGPHLNRQRVALRQVGVQNRREDR